MDANGIIERIADNGALTSAAGAVQKPLRTFLEGKPEMRDLLRGAWLGHAVHPVLTDLTIGNYTAAFLLDITGRSEMEDAADYLLALGIVSAVGTAATGAADWSTLKGRARQTGLLHALSNVAALGLYVVSLAMRRGSRRKAGLRLSYLAGGVATLAAYLGGHLVFNDGIGANEATGRVNQPGGTQRVGGVSDLSYH